MGVVVKERIKGEWWIFIDHKGKRKAKKIGKISAPLWRRQGKSRPG